MTRLSIRIDMSGDDRLGPGKVALLEHIGEHGSISAAARALGMSYRRAWNLVSDLNAIFDSPVVETRTGGRSGGQASVTPFGRSVVDTYRRIEAEAARAVRPDLDLLAAAIRRTPRGE